MRTDKDLLPFDDFHACPYCKREAIYDDLTDHEDPFQIRCKECYRQLIVTPIAHLIHSVGEPA